MHLPPIDWGQMRLMRPYAGEPFKNVATEPQMLDPEIAVSCLPALSTHGQPGIVLPEHKWPWTELQRRLFWLQVTYHALQSIFQHLHLTKGTRTGPMGGSNLAARTAGALPQPNGMGGGGAGAAYPAAVKTDDQRRTPIQQDILAVFNTSNAQASDVGTSTDQVRHSDP